MLRRAAFKPKMPAARPSRQYEGQRPDAPRAPAVRMTAVAAQIVVPLPKAAPVRSESYRRFVAGHACFGCTIVGFSQCAHPNFGKGLSLKTCDLLTFPLCAPHFGLIGCHQQHDLCIDMTRDERRGIEAGYIVRMHAIARAAGRPEFLK